MMSCHDLLSSVPVQNLTAPSAIPREVGLPTCFPAEDLFLLSCSFFLFIFLLVYLVYTILLQRSLKQVPKKNQPHQSCARLLLLLWFTCWATWASYTLHLNRCSQYPARLHQSVRPMAWTRGKQETFANLWIVQVWWECAHTEGHTGMWNCHSTSTKVKHHSFRCFSHAWNPIFTQTDCTMTVPWHTPDISWILMISPTGGYHVGTTWVPCGTTWCQCQAARSPVPQCRCCAAWNCRGSKVSRLGCPKTCSEQGLSYGYGSKPTKNMWFFRDDHQPWGSLGVQGFDPHPYLAPYLVLVWLIWLIWLILSCCRGLTFSLQGNHGKPKARIFGRNMLNMNI